MDRWPGFLPIGPASSPGVPTSGGVSTTFVLEDVPSDGQLPRPNEQYFLNSVYCPVSAAFTYGATKITTIQITVRLMKTGVPVFTQQFSGAANYVPGQTIAYSYQYVTGQLFTPVVLYSGDTALTLEMDVTADQDSFNTLATAGQLFRFGGNVPQPGYIGYDASTPASSPY